MAVPSSAYSTYDGTETPASNVNDNQSATLGAVFAVRVNGYAFGARFYNPTAAARTVYLYDQPNNSAAVPLASATSTATIGWQDVAFSTPYPLVTTAQYSIAYFSPAPGQYTAFVGKGNADVADIDSIESRFAYGATAASPNQNFSTDGYGIGILFGTSLDAGPPAVTGTRSATLPAVGVAGVGLASPRGNRAATLAPATLAAAGGVKSGGQLAAQLVAVAASAAGGTGIAGQASAAVGGATAAAAGAVGIGGQVARIVGVSGAAAAGAVANSAQLVAAIGPVSTTATGTQGNTGQVVASIGGVAASAAGAITISGLASNALASIVASAAGTVAASNISGRLAAIVGGFAVAAQGKAITTGGTQITLARFALAATGTGLAFERSAARTYRIPAEYRVHRIEPENRTWKIN